MTATTIAEPDIREFTLAGAGLHYLSEYGWRTTIIGRLLLLPLGRNVVGVAVAAARAQAIREQVAALGLTYPMVALPGPRAVEVFIASQHVDRLPRRDSSFTALILRNTRIPLPPSRIGVDRLEWTVPPGSSVAELDPLLNVIHAGEPRRYRRAQ